MKARIIEIDRQEIAPGIFRRIMWSSVPIDKLTSQHTNEFFNRTDKMWPQREVISSLEMRRIKEDKKKRPTHFFVSISAPPRKNVNSKDFSKN